MSPAVTVTLATGRDLRFDVPEGGDGPPVFALSVRKCGSSVFNSMVEALGRANGYGFMDVGGDLFRQNVAVAQWQRDPALCRLIRPGVVVGGLRNLPLAFLDDETFVASPKVLMMRDPRDAMVSEYFSSRYSHDVPEPAAGFDDTRALMLRNRASAETSTVDEWALRAAVGFNRSMMAYAPMLAMPRTLVVRYEDFIFAKDELLRLLARHLDWHVDDELIGLILEWADVRPGREDPHAFIRQVAPGDHRQKLKRTTIWRVNRLVRPALRLYGYH